MVLPPCAPQPYCHNCILKPNRGDGFCSDQCRDGLTTALTALRERERELEDPYARPPVHYYHRDDTLQQQDRACRAPRS